MSAPATQGIGSGRRNVAAYLPTRAAAQPDALAVAVARGKRDFTTLTCAELDALCDRSAHALQAVGIVRGPVEIIQYAVWLYYRFNMSHRAIEDLMAKRG